MPSSSAYAAPIDLDLRPGLWEQGGRVVAGLLAAGSLVLTDLAVLAGLLGAWLAMLIWVRDDAKAARRPLRMRLYADGNVECPVTRSALARDPQPWRASALLQGDDDLMQPATLLQATSFLGLMQLRWADASSAQHACLLFPDRITADTRHRLRVWLATHRPEEPMGALPSVSAHP